MKVKELRDLGLEELTAKEKDLNESLFNLKFQKATGQLGNTAMIGKTKRDLARVKTLLREMKTSSDETSKS
ncbi:MAG: 50S ribosomal protein L29 [Deltaproteobacteria bacterium HGW-Deltaproteobacteria-21]|nr:MAG: 50S ribosomal protein L29 [Deltaproteobacteria bacterium HGW-Deltaproteobacteria-21]PKN67471.1 MAG: 50S ribosomal protein L29 [Deltaproteobacteria bacterium HGW-Deltaproteobacteria-15]